MKLSYCLKVVIFALFGITFSAFVHAQTALPPIITKQPVASSTHAKSARLMLYVQALPRDEGALTYQWYYTATAQTGMSYPLTEANITAIKGISVAVPGAGSAQYTLDATTPAIAGTYYYYCVITNTNGSATSFVESSITRIIVVNRTMDDELKNGDMEHWQSAFVQRYQYWYSTTTQTGGVQARDSAALPYNTFGTRWGNAAPTTGVIGSTNRGAFYATDAKWNSANAWYTTHFDYWTTSTFTGPDKPYGVGPIEVGTATAFGRTTLSMAGHGYYAAELSAEVPSSIYQDIATKPGKIYEWSLDFAARTATKEGLAVVIGPSINVETDYNTSITGVTKRWYNAANVPADQVANRVYRYGYDQSNTSPFPLPTYFNDITRKTAADQGIIYDNLSTKTKQSFVTPYNGQTYYVFIADAQKSSTTWDHYEGTYSVPEGQGTTVFAFSYIPVSGATANSGNLLDNVVFKSGNNPVSATAMFYSGRVSLSAKTQPGYVYGIVEIRGSSVILLPNDSVRWCSGTNCTGGNLISPSSTGNLADASISNWFYPNATGNITFGNLTPSKTYRIVGIPVGAVSKETELNTNRNPSLVLDDGYYTEITIPASFLGSNTQMATATSSAQTCDYASIFLTNTDPNVEYAILEKSDSTAIADWKHGLGLATGAAIIFDSLATKHDYLVVARPVGYDEINYKVAAKLSAVLIHTPTPTYCPPPYVAGKVDDILRSQVTRIRYSSTEDRIILTDVNPNGEYGLYNPEDGFFIGLGTGSGLLDGASAASSSWTFTFTGLKTDAIYHLAVREKTTGAVFMVGVRVYPFAPPLNINYEKEWVQLASDSTYVPKEVEYRMRANDPGKSWLAGSGETIDFEKNTTWQAATGTSHLYLGYPRGNLVSILDTMKMLSATQDTLFYRIHPVIVDGWTGPSIAPESPPLIIPKRPEAPQKQDCPPPTPPSGGDYILNYEDLPEKITVLGSYNMQYSTDNGQTYAPPAGMTGSVALTALGYTGAEMTVFLRFPWGMTPTAHFASEVSRQVLLGRGAAPAEAYAVIDNVSTSLINILGLHSDKRYQYKLTTSSTWLPVPEFATSIMGLPLSSDDYEIRYLPACENPASHSQMLSVPLSVEAIDFGNLDCGYDVNGMDSIIHIRNVSTNPVPFTSISIDNTTDFILKSTSPTNIVSAMDAGGLGSNTEYSITPRQGLAVGSYQARITLTYTYNSSINTATADVFLNVVTATPDNNLEAEATDVTATTFTLKINVASGEAIPTGAVIEYHINPFGSDTIKPFEGATEMQVSDNTHFFDMEPATEYTIWYRYKSDTPCYYASPAKSISVKTPYTLDCSKPVVQIDYVAEMLQFKDGYLSDYYEVSVNDAAVNMPYRVSAEADAGDFEVSVRLISTGSSTTFPPSDPCSFTVKGRRDAPATATTSPAITIVNDVKYGNTFEWRVAGSSQWTGPVTTYTPPTWGGYEVRRKAIATTIAGKDTTTGVFASKYTIVFIEAALVPSPARKLYVDIARVDGLGLGNGSSWQNATPSLSSAFKYKNDNPGAVDSIYVAIGTYKPESGGTFTLPSDVVVAGGFQYTWKSDPSDQYTNTINNKDASSILSGDLSATSKALHVVTAGSGGASTLNRFAITAGNANGGGAGNNGGGVYLTGNSTLKLINVLIHSNAATANGGGIYVDNGCTASLTNVTVSANTAASGGGIYRAGGTVTVNNTIIYGNSTDEVNATAGMTFNRSLVKGQTLAGTGNLAGSTDPLFVNAAAKNFHLQKSSPARDAGDNALYVLAGRDPSLPGESDVAGNPRLSNASIDVGAYEYLPLLVLTFDTTCSGVLYNKYTAASVPSAGITFSWKRAEVAGISTPAGSGSSANISETLVNMLKIPVNVKYAFELKLATGQISYDTLTVTVRAPLDPGIIVNGRVTITNNQSGDIIIGSEADASAGDGNYTYKWTKTVDGGVETDIPGSNSPVYTVPAEDKVNTGTDEINIVYKRYVHDGCTADIVSKNEFVLTITFAPAGLALSGVWPYQIVPTTGGYYTGDSHTGNSSGGIDRNGQILIIGTGFSLGTPVTVTLGGVRCTNVTMVNDQMILCTPGASTDLAMTDPDVLADTQWHEGWVDIVVTVGSKTVTKEDGCFYRAPLTISTVTPNNGPVAGGTRVTITGYNFLNYYGTPRPMVIFSVPGGDPSPAIADTVTVSNTEIVAYTTAHLANNVTVTVNNAMEKFTAANKPFTYYPTVYIKNGRWTDYENWEDHSTENIVPYNRTVHPNVSAVHIKANMEQNMNVNLDSITVYPLKSYTVGSGTTVTANVFTLKDDASFLNNGTDAIVKARVQHTLTKGRNWYISSPTQNGTAPAINSTLNVATDGTPITTRVEYYNELNHLWASPSGNFTTGLGYTAFNQNKDIAANFTGKFTDGTKTSPALTRTDGHAKSGFNLTGNPFPSYWRWTEAAARTANLYSTIWYRTNIDGNYAFWSYNAVGNVAVAPGWEDDEREPGYNLSYIPPMQAFWVRVQEGQTGGTLTFSNTERRHANQSANILKSAETRPMLRLAISDGKSADETLIYADKDALNAFDRFDSEKMFANAGVELFTAAPDFPSFQNLESLKDNALVINGLNEIKAGTEIPLSFRADAAGAFDLKAQQILNLDTLDVFLRDNLRQMEFDLKNEPVYHFTSGSEPSPDRFSIVFRSLGAGFDLSGKLSAYENGLKQIVVNNYEGTVYVYDLNGILLAEDVITRAGKIINRRFPSGIYIIRGGGEAVKIVVR